ncbi:alkaline phosphatase [Mycolicibacterium smegmatis]|nr:alkaline phosphatase D family protein [Mycolicibacterium smegmatis]SUB58030.1 alkaline phosphatase [Mycolicibacterium smegmatis]
MSIFGAMADRNPDFFIHSGDAIYADGPVPETQKRNDGGMYVNLTDPARIMWRRHLPTIAGTTPTTSPTSTTGASMPLCRS